jgi:hypothetical protein
MKRTNNDFFGVIGQWSAMFTCVVGILIEIWCRASVGFLLITMGSVFFALFTKIKYYERKK